MKYFLFLFFIILINSNIFSDEFLGVFSGNIIKPLGMGSEINILWKKHNKSKFVKIELSINNSKTWKTIATNYKDTGSYPWIIPDINSKHTQIRITRYQTTMNNIVLNHFISQPFIIDNQFCGRNSSIKILKWKEDITKSSNLTKP